MWSDVWFCLYLCSVVHHEVSASHRVGALGWRDPKMITAGVPHGEETERVPPLVCQIKRHLSDNTPSPLDRKQWRWQDKSWHSWFGITKSQTTSAQLNCSYWFQQIVNTAHFYWTMLFLLYIISYILSLWMNGELLVTVNVQFLTDHCFELHVWVTKTSRASHHSAVTITTVHKLQHM